MAINFSGSTFYDSIGEIVGFKCGVAVSRSEMKELLKKLKYSNYSDITDNGWVRIHSSEYEEIIYEIMKSFGRIEKGFDRFSSISLFHEYKNDSKKIEVYFDIMSMHTDWSQAAIASAIETGSKLIDPTDLLNAIVEKHGRLGLEMVIRVIEGINTALIASPWSEFRQVNWKNPIDLRDLFESEGLNVEFGTFIDQRYIDFLHQNFTDIDKIHWRKFEQLTAEFLDREGFQVDLGPGRGDDGVDVRAWSKDDAKSKPLIIVQCKRQKATIEKPVIKSLYADVIHEDAKTGLLVTTSRLSRGAEETRIARAYPIDVADRNSLRNWLLKLRQPGVG